MAAVDDAIVDRCEMQEPGSVSAATPRIRVLWLIKGLYRGGAQHLLEAMAREVDADRVHVEVAYVMRGQDRLVPAFERAGVAVHCLDATSDLDLRWVPRLRRLLREGDFELLHSHSPLPASLARLFVRTHPHCYTEHNMWSAYRSPTRILNAATFAMSTSTIVVSEGVAESVLSGWWSRRRNEPVEVIYHGYDESAVQRGEAARRRGRELLGLDTRRFVIGMVAGMKPEKNHALLVEALSLVVRSVPDVQLILIGDGPCRASLQRQASNLGIEANVRLLGERNDVPALLPALDAFVLSSDVEGLPVALLEAMASGIPAVATAVGGTPEVLRDGSEGFLVPAGDAAVLADRIVRLTDHGLRIRMGAVAQRRSTEFSCRRATRRNEDLYMRLLRAR